MPTDDHIPTHPEFTRKPSRVPDPQRFRVSKGTLRLDKFMTRFIFVGGLGVILAIFGIFFFILAEILPLFKGAKIEALQSYPTGHQDILLMGADEWSQYPFLLSESGVVTFIDLAGGKPLEEEQIPIPEGVQITCASYTQKSQSITVGLNTGEVMLGRISYKPRFSEDGERSLEADIEWDDPQLLGEVSHPVIDIDVQDSEKRRTVAGLTGGDAQTRAWVFSLVQKRSLFGASGFKLDDQTELTGDLSGTPVQILTGAGAESVVVLTDTGEVHFFEWNGTDWDLRQVFTPFDSPGSIISSMNFIQGEVSLTFTSTSGEHLVYSLFRAKDAGERTYGKTKEFPPFRGGASLFAKSSRNKAFLLGNRDQLSLRYSTTGDIRWQSDIEKPFGHVLISAKFDRILGIDEEGTLKVYSLDDPHPEAGFRAFFSKIWYEGQEAPKYLWQSTGGSDDFEPKLSLIPLIVGSLKGTFYALIFAIPIALLAAIYTSQFLDPSLKRVIKPGIEIMASLPSVVLGFLAALWLAPLIEDQIPSVILVCICIPATAVLFGYAWNLLPIHLRILIPKGREFIVFLPVLVISAIIAWKLGPLLESIAFRFTDPATGETIADFRLWWETWTGNQFQQRNSLVVGFMMGFAVIPIIYTIADDALSAVPPSLVSGSLALGASRWQSTARVVLPTAAAGIFSACMIGLGRAVGETMIVVMATGNTPILDFDIFSGMRTLSANIAVELPEAPHGGTLYRTLFLGAFVLFVLTFAVNTVAEITRNRLRERFKVVS